MRRIATSPLWRLLAEGYPLLVAAWFKRRWRLRTFFLAAFRRRLDWAASLRRAARVPPGRLVAQRCIMTGQCVLSSFTVRPNYSLSNVWTPCLLMSQWNGCRGMYRNPV